jgi:6-pyruvoyltetrahydropterin/6-carboxytetrahydropterin synthase
VQITHREEFSAAHRLASPELSEQENRELYGPCFTMHGHNYGLAVTVEGAVDARTGMVINLTVLMRLMRELIFDAVDHKCLNTDVPFLEDIIPTAENLAIAFWNRLEPHINGTKRCRLYRVRIEESQTNQVEYFGPTS